MCHPHSSLLYPKILLYLKFPKFLKALHIEIKDSEENPASSTFKETQMRRCKYQKNNFLKKEETMNRCYYSSTRDARTNS